MRKKLFSVIEPVDNGDKLSNIYDFIMMATIVISVVPLAFKETNTIFQWIDYITVIIFILEVKCISEKCFLLVESNFLVNIQRNAQRNLYFTQ